jgi:PAS domain S-box-containing protein
MQSDPLIRAAFDAIQLPIQIVDNECRLVFANRLSRDLWRSIGVDAEQSYGKTHAEIFPFVPDSDTERYRQVIASGVPTVSQETFLVQGVDVVVEIIRSPVAVNGRVTHVVSLARVVTEELRTQESLRESEETTKALLDASTELMFLVSQGGTIITLNEMAASRLGKTVDELKGKSGLELIPGEMQTRLKQALDEVIASGTPYRYRDTAGEVVLDISLHPVKHDRGLSDAVAIFARDLTEHERIIAALRQSEEVARALLNATTESMILIEADGRIVTLNEIAAARIGKTVDQAIGANGADMFPPEVWQARELLMKKVVQSRLPERFSDRRFGRAMEVSLYPVTDAAGNVTRLAVFANDVTGREEAVAAVQMSEERLRQQYDNLPIPAFRWEYAEGEFVLRDCNEAGAKISRRNAPTLFGIKASEMYRDRPDIQADLRKAYQEKTSHCREMNYRFKLSGFEIKLIAHYVFIPSSYVMVYTIDLTEQRKAEEDFRALYEQLQVKIEERTRELAGANEQLSIERESLRQKNIALTEVIGEAGRSRKALALAIQSNIDKVVLPILEKLQDKLDPNSKHLAKLARTSLEDLMSQFGIALGTRSSQLTIREIELCNLILRGRTTKEIAELRSTSVQTVLTQRKIIRRKLDIQGKKTNLAAFLASMMMDKKSNDILS